MPRKLILKNKRRSAQEKNTIVVEQASGLFYLSRTFQLNLRDLWRPPISRITDSFVDLFQELRESSRVSSVKLKWEHVPKPAFMSMPQNGRTIVSFRTVYTLMMIQATTRKRPLLKTKANVFLVHDSKSVVWELHLQWWQDGWAIEPKAFGTQKILKGSRIFFRDDTKQW